ncbi:MAG: hypothetical protein QM270_10660 [Bacillota bacterium]|nr:hypothetical protein [Bacillota bacterium]
MARYCFYCNAELKPGEACSCRTATQRARTTGAEQSEQSASGPTARKARARRRSRPLPTFDWRRVRVQAFAWLRNLSEFITRPMQAVRRHAQARPATAVTALFFAAVLTAVLLVAITLDSSLGSLLLYRSRKLAESLTLGTRLRMFLRFLAYPLLYFGIKWLLTFFLLRRQALRLPAAAAALTPGAVYLAMVMALGLCFVRSGGLQALCLFVAAFVICQIADYLAIGSLVSMPPDRLLRLTLLGILLLAIVLGAVLNILLPDLSDFRVTSNLA